MRKSLKLDVQFSDDSKDRGAVQFDHRALFEIPFADLLSVSTSSSVINKRHVDQVQGRRCRVREWSDR
jgi:hypothetical protein